MKAFKEVADRLNLQLNPDKCEYGITKLKFLGHLLENGTISPDPDRLTPLKELPTPNCGKSLKRALGLFSYYSPWVENFSDRISPLLNISSFPIAEELKSQFQAIKDEICKASVAAIEDEIPFTIETDASASLRKKVVTQSVSTATSVATTSASDATLSDATTSLYVASINLSSCTTISAAAATISTAAAAISDASLSAANHTLSAATQTLSAASQELYSNSELGATPSLPKTSSQSSLSIGAHRRCQNEETQTGRCSQKVQNRLFNSSKNSQERRRSCMQMNGNTNRKRKRQSVHKDVNEALTQWFTQACAHGATVTDHVIRQKASQLAVNLEKVDFEPSNGWLMRWKQANNVSFKKFHGESTSADHGSANEWVTNVLPQLFRGYNPKDVWNCDETGIIYKAMLSGSLRFAGDEQSNGTKVPKDRLTMLQFTNMDGSEKQTVVVGKLETRI
ncbi:unnamed protein product [Acanthosepion pharaonis]|uniref:HTH CENPB-type domain-containing protein n=1 Tax=Acanthosepion pharaonis TaxID=158019 RepID=A0A812CW31_ACAPH|nr:unnamed protein product [Sepia pharaonis]